jgi:S1-C subfamily serine protease
MEMRVKALRALIAGLGTGLGATARRFSDGCLAVAPAPLIAAMLLLAASPAVAQDNPLDAVLGLRAEVPADARTAGTLGRQRQGSAVLIDSAGLALTIGYLVLEASQVSLLDAEGRTIPADIVAYDHTTGFGLVRALLPIEATPLPLAAGADPSMDDPLLVVSRAGTLEGTQVSLADRRVFAGYWEYLLDEALFTSPMHNQFGGAALIDTDGRLVGIGSLRVGDSRGDGRPSPGNMFVPASLLPPILGDLLTTGHTAEAKPWLGIISQESEAGVVLGQVTDGGPAAAAGLRPGDRVVAVGDDAIGNLETLYRSVWKLGGPGVVVPMRVERGDQLLDVQIKSIDRLSFLRLDPTF